MNVRRASASRLVLPAACATFVLSALLVGSSSPARATDPPPGAADFAPIARVLLSPRCLNCHPAGDAPLVGDDSRRHPMNISRASEGAGLPCTTCHRDANADAPHAPPGVPHWRMPPKETPMVFQGKTPRDLCLTLKDPAKNGGKTLPALEEHFASDAIVLWGYHPGGTRPVPPVPHDVLVEHVKRWISAGAPCP